MVIDPKRAKMRADRCILLICDMQKEFSYTFKFDNVVRNSSKLVNMLKVMKVPMIIAVINPQVCGKIVPQIDIHGMTCYTKTTASMCIPEIMDQIKCHSDKSTDESNLFHIILIGMETHVCIENTAIDLRMLDYEVVIVADCCTSGLPEDRLLAFQRMRDIGCQITTTEAIVTKLLGGPNHQEYTSIQPFLQYKSKSTDLYPNL